ncbi:MAG: hypothetical protein WCZ28_06150 [Burkholderiaceae bacterium]
MTENNADQPVSTLRLAKIEIIPAARGSWLVEVKRVPIDSTDRDWQNEEREKFGFTDINDLIAWLKEIGGPLP